MSSSSSSFITVSICLPKLHRERTSVCLLLFSVRLVNIYLRNGEKNLPDVSGREAGSADRVAYLADSLRRSAFRWFPALFSSSCPSPPQAQPEPFHSSLRNSQFPSVLHMPFTCVSCTCRCFSLHFCHKRDTNVGFTSLAVPDGWVCRPFQVGVRVGGAGGRRNHSRARSQRYLTGAGSVH